MSVRATFESGRSRTWGTTTCVVCEMFAWLLSWQICSVGKSWLTKEVQEVSKQEFDPAYEYGHARHYSVAKRGTEENH